MHRREFLQSLLAAPLSASQLPASPVDSKHGEIHLISDRPQVDIPPLFEHYQRSFGQEAKSFTCLNQDPKSKELIRALKAQGWSHTARFEQAQVAFSFHRLEQKTLPSITFVKDGRIEDIRSWKYRPPWQSLLNIRPATLLTVASFIGRHPLGESGEAAVLYRNGQNILQLPLSESTTRKIPTKKGSLIIKVVDRRAWIHESSCRNKICISTPPVSLAGERIICAPNHFLMEIQGRAIDTAIG
ncbi:MAG: NusG domain II-containing protein [Candidatus Aminicenantes bacterium]|nr:NusG domain II-containing protein [Candidatus Aminicenantes bacterium]